MEILLGAKAGDDKGLEEVVFKFLFSRAAALTSAVTNIERCA